MEWSVSSLACICTWMLLSTFLPIYQAQFKCEKISSQSAAAMCSWEESFSMWHQTQHWILLIYSFSMMHHHRSTFPTPFPMPTRFCWKGIWYGMAKPSETDRGFPDILSLFCGCCWIPADCGGNAGRKERESIRGLHPTKWCSAGSACWSTFWQRQQGWPCTCTHNRPFQMKCSSTNPTRTPGLSFIRSNLPFYSMLRSNWSRDFMVQKHEKQSGFIYLAVDNSFVDFTRSICLHWSIFIKFHCWRPNPGKLLSRKVLHFPAKHDLQYMWLKALSPSWQPSSIGTHTASCEPPKHRIFFRVYLHIPVENPQENNGNV